MKIYVIDWGFGMVWAHVGSLKSAKKSIEEKMINDEKVRPYKVIIKNKEGIPLTCSRYHEKELFGFEKEVVSPWILVDRKCYGFYEKWSDEG